MKETLKFLNSLWLGTPLLEVPCCRFEISKPEDTQLIFQSETEETHRIRIVKEYRNSERDDKVTYFRYPKIDFMDPLGACAHPYVITHEKMAEALVEYIKNLEMGVKCL